MRITSAGQRYPVKAVVESVVKVRRHPLQKVALATGAVVTIAYWC
jgi:hypothetical protein